MSDTTATRTNERRSVGERREQLVDAAIAVMAEGGLTGTTTRAVTDRAGLALGAFHYAFESKEQLLRAVLARRAEEVEATLRSLVKGALGAEDVIGNLTQAAWDVVQTQRELQLAWYELTVHALRNPELASVAAEQYDRMVEVVHAALADLSDLRDDRVEDFARFVVATLDGLILQDLVHDDPEAARRRLELFTTVVTPVAASEEAFAEALDA